MARPEIPAGRQPIKVACVSCGRAANLYVTRQNHALLVKCGGRAGEEGCGESRYLGRPAAEAVWKALEEEYDNGREGSDAAEPAGAADRGDDPAAGSEPEPEPEPEREPEAEQEPERPKRGPGIGMFGD